MNQYGYPLEPGQYGIDFEQLQLTGPDDQLYTSESGSLLIYRLNDKEIYIVDRKKNMRMYVKVDTQGTMTANIRTRRGNSHHSDFFATKFLFLAHQYFADRQVEIKAFTGKWLPSGENYHRFMNTYYNTGGDKIQATLATWTGDVLINGIGGYSLAPEDILVQNDLVIAAFRRVHAS